MTALPKDVVADLSRRVAELEQRLQSSLGERDEAIAQQAATAEVLQVINASPGDLAPVFDAIVEKALRLCDAAGGALWLIDGDMARATGGRGGKMTDAFYEYVEHESVPVKYLLGRAQDRPFVHVIDLKATKPYQNGVPFFVANVDLGGVRTSLSVPLNEAGRIVGIFTLIRKEVRPFTDKQIALVQSFAAQAQIAMKNARLFNETREALERQTATADILKVIASSPSDVQPVFEASAERSNRLVEALSTAVYSLVDDTQHLMAFTRKDPEADAALQALFPRPLAAFPWGEQIRNGEMVHIPDTEVELSARPSFLEMARKRGFRSFLLVPLLRDRTPIGLISVTRAQPGMFAAHHIQLLQTFADQAVIAIENTRLFNETREALERQTATADILKVIASSPADVQPVFEAIATSANRLIGGFSTAVFRFVDGMTHLVAFTRTHQAADDVLKSAFPRRLADFPPFEWVREGEVAQIADAEILPDDVRDITRARGYRSVLFSPLMSKGTPIGLISVTRVEAGSFAPHHVQLLQTFADQAVIAIDNVRLFDEVQARTEDLRESLQQQTATADVLKVISRSAFDLQTVLDTLTESAARLCNADMAAMTRQGADGGLYYATNYNLPADWLSFAPKPRPERGSAVGRALLATKALQIADVLADPEYAYPELQKAVGYRTLLAVPLLRLGQPIGVLFLARKTVEPFTDKQIELVSTFADQAVIAIENVRLFEEVQTRTRELSQSVEELRALGEVSQAVNSTVDLETVLTTIVAKATQLSRTEAGAIYVFDNANQEFRLRATHGMDDKIIAEIRDRRIRIGETAIGEAAEQRRPIQIPDIQNDPSSLVLDVIVRAGYRALLIVPLLAADRIVGALVVRRKEPGEFPKHTVDLLQTFAAQAVLAIQNANLFTEVEEKSR